VIDGTPHLGAPAQKFLGGAVVGPPCVQVADIGGEEFEEAQNEQLIHEISAGKHSKPVAIDA
jgi:hypothetical protein